MAKHKKAGSGGTAHSDEDESAKHKRLHFSPPLDKHATISMATDTLLASSFLFNSFQWQVFDCVPKTWTRLSSEGSDRRLDNDKEANESN